MNTVTGNQGKAVQLNSDVQKKKQQLKSLKNDIGLVFIVDGEKTLNIPW